jgi:hypothetical protein
MSSINFNSIDSFKQNFGGGTRPNRFSVTASFPNDIDVSDDEIDFKIFATFPFLFWQYFFLFQ